MKSKSKPTPAPVLAVTTDVPLAAGLDPKVYEASVLIARRDGKPLDDAECEAIEHAYKPKSRRKPTAPKRAAAKVARTKP